MSKIKLNYVACCVFLIWSNFFLLGVKAQSYQLDQFIGSAVSDSGVLSSGGSFLLTSVVGDPVSKMDTLTPSWFFSQGFLNSISGDINVEYEIFPESCLGKNDGKFKLSRVFGCKGPYLIEIMDTNQRQTFNPNALSAGTYQGFVKGSLSSCQSTFMIVVSRDSEVCDINFFNAMSPNNDGINDKWKIENIELYSDNKVIIVNSVGDKVWEANGYNNGNIVFEGRDFNNQDLPQGTYYYFVVIRNKKYNGWLEIIR